MNALMSTLSPSATAMIRKDHTMVLNLFHKLTPQTSPAVREAAIRNLCAALEIHAQVEEEIFYPALRDAGIDSPVLAQAEPEHQRMRELMLPLRQSADPDSTPRLAGQPANDERALAPGQPEPEQRLRALDELMNVVMHHMADEETQLLPAAERQCSPEQLAELGARMTQRKMALARPRAGALMADAARAAPAKSTVMAVGALVAMAWLLGHRRHPGHRYS